MTVLSIHQIAGGRELDVDIDGNKNASLVYKVITNGVMTLPAILSDPMLSVIGETYPDNPDMYIHHVGIRDMSDNVIAYDLTLEYTNERELAINPLSEPARYAVSSEYYQIPAFTDRYGYGLVTSSGEYPEGLFKEAVQLNISITKNVTAVPPWVLTAQGATNISGFAIPRLGLVFSPEVCRLAGLSVSDELSRNGYGFYRLMFTISYRQIGWKLEYMDRGFYELKDGPLSPALGGVRYQQKILVDGHLPAVPIPLNGNGEVLIEPTLSSVVILKKDVNPAFDFNTLPLV